MTLDTKPWRPFTYAGATYALDHLKPRTITYVVAEKDGKPEIRYKVNVAFSTHCFTRGIRGEDYDKALQYRDGREVRLFDFQRFGLSKALPGIIETIMGRDCHHAERGNFFTVAEADENGAPVEYEIFFTVSKSSQRGHLNLFLQSAYTGATLPKKPRRIRFEIILFNVLHQKSMR